MLSCHSYGLKASLFDVMKVSRHVNKTYVCYAAMMYGHQSFMTAYLIAVMKA